MPVTTSKFRIRRALASDAPGIARLSGQLGYPCTGDEMSARLTIVLEDDGRAVFVVDAEDGLLGWIGVEHRVTLEGARRCAPRSILIAS